MIKPGQMASPTSRKGEGSKQTWQQLLQEISGWCWTHSDPKELLFPFKIMSPKRAERLLLATDYLLAATAGADTHWWELVVADPDTRGQRQAWLASSVG